MTDDEAEAVFAAGQALLSATYHHLTDRALGRLDATLDSLYADIGLPSVLCDHCDALTPKRIMKNGYCPNCQE
mgnify:FL=1